MPRNTARGNTARSNTARKIKKPARRAGTPRHAHQTLPGEISPNAALARMLRVDHAGEFGAKQIYKGQLMVLGHQPVGKTIRHMAQQEEVHLAAFDALLQEQRVRPTALMPFWRLAGLALGAGTAALGERAAMACTVAVEEVIIDHYQKQIDMLRKHPQSQRNKELAQLLEKFRDDEDEHRQTGHHHQASDLPYYPLLHRTIRKGCKLAIWLSERI